MIRRMTRKMKRRMIKRMKRKTRVIKIRKTLRAKTKVNQLINDTPHTHTLGIVPLNHITIVNDLCHDL